MSTKNRFRTCPVLPSLEEKILQLRASIENEKQRESTEEKPLTYESTTKMSSSISTLPRSPAKVQVRETLVGKGKSFPCLIFNMILKAVFGFAGWFGRHGNRDDLFRAVKRKKFAASRLTACRPK